MLAVIGGHALRLHGYNLGRESKDIDLVGDYDEIISFLKCKNCTSIYPISNGKKVVGKNSHTIYECEITWPNSTAEELYGLIQEAVDLREVHGYTMYVASPEICYVLKMSHRFLKNSPHFKKTMDDIWMLRRSGHLAFRPIHEDQYQQKYIDFRARREKETYNYSHPKLNQSKSTFFNESVPYVYDHDSIHETVKLGDKPAYSYFKPDEAEVLTSRKMFFECSEEIRLAAVYEESAVLALERSQIPYPEMDRRRSFEIALQKVCTSITSGWFRDYAWEHYYQVLELYEELESINKNYVDRFTVGLNVGIVQPYDGNKTNDY